MSENRPSYTRRHVLGLMAAGGVVVAGLTSADAIPRPRSASLSGSVGGDPSVPLLVVRGADGLLVTLSFANLEVRSPLLGGGPKLALRDPAAPGYVVLGLRPQSLAERAFFDDGTGVTPPVPPVPTVVAGPSRLVLTIPPGSEPIDYALEALLNFSAFPLAVSSLADHGTGGALPTAAPGAYETTIEAPWRLFLSPPSTATFSAARTPVTRNGRTELWHARAVAARRADATADERPLPVPVRAVWSPDLPAGSPLTGPDWALDEHSVALTPQQRRDLVAATMTEDGAAAATLLLVSPMGASLDVRGGWPLRNDVVSWRHRSWLGRDNHVKVEKPGFLFPFGFRAVRVDITERVLDGGVAFLRKQQFIVVREPTVSFPGPGQPNDGRSLPFLAATTTTLVSPPLVAQPDPIGSPSSGATWVRVAGASGPVDLQYRLLLTGQDGRQLSADLPMVFVPAGVSGPEGASNPAYDPAQLTPIINGYHASSQAGRRTLHLAGQKLAFVKPADGAAEETALPTYDLMLLAELSTASPATMLAQRRLNAYPTMGSVPAPPGITAADAPTATAEVRLEALDAVGGAQAARTTISLDPTYLSQGMGGPANHGEVWARVASQARLQVPQQIGGGLAAPALNVEGLSRALGPVADPGKIAVGDFHPEAYFPLDDITLLGGIPLKSVIGDVLGIADPRGPAGENVPKVVTVRRADAVDTVVTWRPTLKATDLFVPASAEPDSRLSLTAVFRTDLTSGATSTTITGDLRNVTLRFVGTGALAFIEQKVTRLRFESRNGGKPTVDVQLGASKFLGDLAFLADLQSRLPALPGGIKVDTTPRGVTAGLSIAIPAVAIGVVLVQNLAIGVLLDLPFNGDQAVLAFDFATREHPFQVTVSALGGGGFLGIGLGTRGVQRVEGALEFGAAVALDLGVASGSVSIMAGIYFMFAQRMDAAGNAVEPAGPTTVITGYVRATGELEVLGLIHVSLEFYLGLTFTAKSNGHQAKVEGTATLSVRVEVLLFSKSVDVTMHKEFGAGPDPSFGQQISAGDWNTYCAAFAA
jgi:hypothetical protein